MKTSLRDMSSLFREENSESFAELEKAFTYFDYTLKQRAQERIKGDDEDVVTIPISAINALTDTINKWWNKS